MPPLLRQTLSRVGMSLLVLWGVSMLIFVIARVIPAIPPASRSAPMRPPNRSSNSPRRSTSTGPSSSNTASGSAILFSGDLGRSLYTNRPVTQDIAEFLPATLELVFVAAVLMVAIGIPLGILAARYRGRWPDHLIRILSLLTVSAPAFVWAVVLMLIFAYALAIFPIAGRLSDDFTIPVVTGFLTIDTLIAGDFAAFADALHHIVLPAVALSLSGIGQAARLTRANMIETYDKPYIEMAQAYGFPNAASPASTPSAPR